MVQGIPKVRSTPVLVNQVWEGVAKGAVVTVVQVAAPQVSQSDLNAMSPSGPRTPMVVDKLTLFNVGTTSDKWVLDVIKHAYTLEFHQIPSFSGIAQTKPNSDHMASVMSLEIQNLLQKKAIREQPMGSTTGHFSHFFLIP